MKILNIIRLLLIVICLILSTILISIYIFPESFNTIKITNNEPEKKIDINLEERDLEFPQYTPTQLSKLFKNTPVERIEIEAEQTQEPRPPQKKINQTRLSFIGTYSENSKQIYIIKDNIFNDFFQVTLLDTTLGFTLVEIQDEEEYILEKDGVLYIAK